jgi:hypothetical protein
MAKQTKGGDGLCCANREGSYLLRYNGVLVASGGEYSASNKCKLLFAVDPLSVHPSPLVVADKGTIATATLPPTLAAPDGVGVVGGSAGNVAVVATATTMAMATVIAMVPPSAASIVEDDGGRGGSTKGVGSGGGMDSNKINQRTWWCGISWECVMSNCKEATPCPGGDVSNCPEEWSCFAWAPCTLSPPGVPTSALSMLPSADLSPPPTGLPWGEEALAGFLYGGGDGDKGEDGSPTSGLGGTTTTRQRRWQSSIS